MPLTLKLTTPKGTILETQADEVYFPTVLGPVGVLPGYTRACFALAEAGILHYVYQGTTHYYTVFSGAVTVKNDLCLLCSPLIEDATIIDLARAKEAELRAKSRLEKEKEEVDIKRAKGALLRAITRIEARTLAHGEKK